MVVTDSIGDMISRINNAICVKSDEVKIPSSKMKEKIAGILKDEGFIINYDVNAKNNKKLLRIFLKYSGKKKSAISEIKRISTPGCHFYSKFNKIGKLRGGFGTIILSTSRGLMTDREARSQKVGGEIICSVW